MAKRKSKVKPAPRKVQPKLETAFTCPFCNHDKSVECTFDRKLKIGIASCRICDESYATSVHGLTEPIDIYSEWIDECEKANDIEDYPSKRAAH